MTEANPVTVSIIIPIFNAEKTLERCLETVLIQTYRAYEILLIDDGSTDRSPEICRNYQNRYPDKIRYIRQENSGPASARNTGIENSRGKYLAFTDADDTVDPGMISAMTESAETEQADMVLCAYWLENGTTTEEKRYRLPTGLYQGANAQQVAYSLLNEGEGDIPPYSWVRLVRKSVLLEKDLRFQTGMMRSEDYHFWARVHFSVDRVYLLSDICLYRYIENKSSVTHRHIQGYWEDVLFIYRDLLEKLPQDMEIKKRLDTMLVKRSLIALNNAVFCPSLKETRQEIKAILGDDTLARVISLLSRYRVSRFQSYRRLMTHHGKLLIECKYLLRHLRSSFRHP